MEQVRLNIGGGDTDIPGYINVDRKNGTEAYPLAYADESVDEIYASHVLEHFSHADMPKVLADWFRVLKPGARIRISVPDIYKAVETAKKCGGPITEWIYGGQRDENDFHKTGFDFSGAAQALADAGFVCIGPFESEYHDGSKNPISANVEGFKPTARQQEAAFWQREMCMVASVPKLGYTSNFYSIAKAIQRLGMRYESVGGAFWEQCLTRGLCKAIENPEANYVVTVDYDTAFTSDNLIRLVMLMEMYPNLDAIAPVQLGREGMGVLSSATPEQAKAAGSNPHYAIVTTAHFGLTVFRASTLRKFPHPWLWSQPDPDGKWETGRIDADIYFWRKWAENGNTVALARDVQVSHMQNVHTWVSKTGKPLFQHESDYNAVGMPSDALQSVIPLPENPPRLVMCKEGCACA